ncbi:GntR family transcriptional regulator [Chryseomicrobium sp. FSL W7-1435]|uniref:FadR/GntR family transcriptional regulator n=1 Tax=Chryseomicrobium sp. FSL W7-1435 TaxID=2921704 RepID=UPI00315ABED4
MGKGDDMTSASPKLFTEIVRQLRELIEQERIQIGGKLPSERELAERLEVGRSTIREALRSLELLGLIETRRGEGTFLADFRKHKLVEVLATFILKDTKSTEDIYATRQALEKQAIHEIMKSDFSNLSILKNALEVNEDIEQEWLIKELMIASGNRLALKIWLLLNEYSSNPFKKPMSEEDRSYWKKLIQAVELGDEMLAQQILESWQYGVKGETPQ